MLSETKRRDPQNRSKALLLRDEKIAWREIDGDIIALDLDASSYLQVSGSGVPLWRRLLDGASREELVDTLLMNYRVEPEVARLDVDYFIDELTSRGLLEQ